MKTFLYFFILISYIIISSRANATIIIVNNTTNSPGQYTTLQAAVDAATDGDTLHIEPSNFAYDNNNEQGAIYITKSLTIIGIGHKPNKEFSFPSHIGALRLSGNATSIGTKLIGLRVLSISMACGQSMNNLLISHCRLDYIGTTYESNCFSPTGYYNALFENCLLGEVGYSVGNNVVFQNCVFTGYQHVFGNATNQIIKNCLFIHNGGSTFGINANGALFENNIFYGITSTTGNGTGMINCVLNNNISYQTANDAFLGIGNSYNNNIISQDPLFVDYTASSPTYNSIYNYRLQTLSPGHNAGTDGQDIGLYGNNSYWSETGEHPDLPVVRFIHANNTIIPSGGTITFDIKVTTFKTDNP